MTRREEVRRSKLLRIEWVFPQCRPGVIEAATLWQVLMNARGWVCLLAFFASLGIPQIGRAADTTPKSVARSDAPDLPSVSVRFAAHAGFDRLVLLLPEGSDAVSHQSGSDLSIRISGVGRVASVAVSGRRLHQFSGGSGQASLVVAPGDRVRIWRMENRLVVDVLDPSATARSPAAPRPVASPLILKSQPPSLVRTVPPRTSSPLLAKSMPPNTPAIVAAPIAPVGTIPATDSRKPQPGVQMLPASASASASAAASAAVTPVTPSSSPIPSSSPDISLVRVTAADTISPGPASVAAVLLAPDSGLPGPSVLFPFSNGTGAASFARAGEGHVVFDVSQPMDLGALKDDPVFGGVTEELLSDGTHLRLRLTAPAQLRLSKRQEGWVISIVQPPASAPLSPMSTHCHDGLLSIDAKSPGRVVVLQDDVNGGRLLIGTQLSSGERIASPRSTPEFAVLPTWQGVAIQPISDRLTLGITRTGFDLQAAGTPALSAAWAGDAAASWPDGRLMTRVFDLPDLPSQSLSRRLGAALRDAAVTPKPARYGPRLAVAQAMLALGMDVEAAAVLRAASTDDPSHRDDPVAKGLLAAAKWLSVTAGGSAPQAGDIDLASLGGSDEASLWRGLLQPDRSDPARQAASLAATWPMVLDYPPNLRRLVLRPLADLMLAGGQNKAVAALLAASKDPMLDLPRAAWLQNQHRTDEALALLDRVANRPDRLARAEALRQAVEVRLASHKLDAGAAADALHRQIYAWRGGDRELQLRERIAELKAQAGAWRPALAMLRETEGQFPDAHEQLRASEIGIVTRLLRSGEADKLNAFDLVTLADEDADLLTGTDVETNLTPILVDKLLALDLPSRAEPILHRLFERATPGSPKAELGVRLASLISDRGDGPAALAILGQSDDEGLSPDLVSRIALLRSHLLLAEGKPHDALAALSGQTGRQVSALTATIMEQQHNWAGAAAVLATTISDPQFRALSDPSQRDALLRLARDESQAGDMAALRRLRETQLARFKTGQGAELFAVLTAEPIGAAADLPRAARELTEIRDLPGKLSHAQTF